MHADTWRAGVVPAATDVCLLGIWLALWSVASDYPSSAKGYAQFVIGGLIVFTALHLGGGLLRIWVTRSRARRSPAGEVTPAAGAEPDRREAPAPPGTPAGTPAAIPAGTRRIEWRGLLGTVVLSVAYLWAIPFTGYLLASLVFGCVGIIWRTGLRPWLLLMVIALPIVLWAISNYLLNTPLPAGQLGIFA